LLKAESIESQLKIELLSGHLPMGASGQMVLQQQHLVAQKVNERAANYLALYVNELPTQTIAVVVRLPWGEVKISAEIEALRQQVSAHNQSTLTCHASPTLQIIARPGAVATGSKDEQIARVDVLINLWPQHVLLCAAGWNVQSVAVGLDGVAVLSAIPEKDAKALLVQWLTVYAQAWAQPLPVTFKAGLAFVSEHMRLVRSAVALNAPKKPDPGLVPNLEPVSKPANTASFNANLVLALEKAQKEFSDDFSKSTDLARSLYVQRSFDNFDPLIEGLPQWAPLLYRELIQVATMEGGAA